MGSTLGFTGMELGRENWLAIHGNIFIFIEDWRFNME